MSELDSTSDRILDFLAGPSRPGPPELEARFGELAVEKGYLTQPQLDQCRAEQRRSQDAGRPAALGQVILQRGFLSEARCQELLSIQKASLQVCARCQRYYNVAAHTPGVRLRCLGCGEELQGFGDLATRVITSGAPDLLPEQSPELVRQLAKYLLTKVVGHGGMGTVYEAQDLELHRRVAVKLLREGLASPRLLKRLHREAAIAAQLSHPNIVGIHEVGMVPAASGETIHYIAMDFVEGSTLADLISKGKTSRRELLRILEDVARAVAYAHGKGVIHRDLKPDNVLVNVEGRAILTDFGLARNEGSHTRLTASQAVMGTPHYMAPEQVRGRQKEIGRCTDVYGLGAILYEILAGHPPFVASTNIGLFQKILNEEPLPPSRLNRGVERDLEVVCLKALEKDHHRRYGSALGFAEDLARFRAGEPIIGRPASALYRIRKRVRKHRAIVATAAATLLGALLVGMVVLPAWNRARAFERSRQEAHRASSDGQWERALLEAERALAIRSDPALETLVRDSRERIREAKDKAKNAEVEASTAREQLRKARLVGNVLDRWMRLADTVAELERLAYDSTLSTEQTRRSTEEPWRKIERFMGETPSDRTSQAVMRALSGWARGLAGYPEECRLWTAEARELDPDLPYGALMEGLQLLSYSLLQQPLPTTHYSIAVLRFDPPPPETEEQKQVRGRIEELLGQATGATVWGEALAEDLRRAVEGLRHMQQGLHVEAERDLSAALGGGLLMFRNDLLMARVITRYSLRNFDQAAADLEEVLASRPNSAPMHSWMGLIHRSAVQAADQAGQDPRPGLRRAAEEYTAAIKLDPSFTDAYVNRGGTNATFAAYLSERGEEADQHFELALLDFERALQMDPDRAAEVEYNRGHALRMLARHRFTRGGPSEETYRQAIESFTKALRLQPGRAEGYDARGVAWAELGKAQRHLGRDPTEALRAAILDHDEALAREPDFADAHFHRADTWNVLGEFEEPAGRDGRASFQEAIESANKAMRLVPGGTFIWNARGTAYLNLGIAEADRQSDPTEHFEQAIQDYTRLIERTPGALAPYNNRAIAYYSLGEWLRSHGGDSPPRFEQSLADLERVLGKEPNFWMAWNNKGQLFMKWGRNDDAVRAFEKALEINPGLVLAKEGLEAARRLASEQAKREAPPR